MAAVAAPPTTPPPSEGSVIEAEVRPAVPSTVLTPRTLLVVSHTELDEDFSEPAMGKTILILASKPDVLISHLRPQ